MKLSIRFQSISDIITNSSSEIFTVIDERPIRELRKLIRHIGEENLPSSWDKFYDLPEEEQDKFDHCSGMGGELEVKDWEDRYNEWLEWIPDNKKHQATPEIWALQYKESLEELKKLIIIDIDWHRKPTIDWILENLWVIDADGGCFEKDPETGRVLRRITHEEAEALPEERKISW